MPPQVAGRLPVEVGDADVRDLAVPLFEPLRISGAVRVEGDGKPALDGIRLVLMQADNQYSLSRAGAVAPDGTFKIDGVAPDKYLLAAFNLPERMYVK